MDGGGFQHCFATTRTLITIYSEPSVSLILTTQLVIAGFLWWLELLWTMSGPKHALMLETLYGNNACSLRGKQSQLSIYSITSTVKHECCAGYYSKVISVRRQHNDRGLQEIAWENCLEHWYTDTAAIHQVGCVIYHDTHHLDLATQCGNNGSDSVHHKR